MGNDSDEQTLVNLTDEVDQLKHIIAAQAERIETLEAKLETRNTDKIDDGVGSQQSRGSLFSRRSLLYSVGLAGLAGYGASAASAERSPANDGAKQVPESLALQQLSGGLVENQPIHSLLGTGLSVEDNVLSAAQAANDRVDVEIPGPAVAEDVEMLYFDENLTATESDADGQEVTVDAKHHAVYSSNSHITSNIELLNFGTNLKVTKHPEKEGTVTVESVNPAVTDSSSDTESENVDEIGFERNLTATEEDQGIVKIDATDTHIVVSDDGLEVAPNGEEIDFGVNLTVTDEGGGAVTVDAPDNIVVGEKTDYEIQKNGQDGTGIINFKT